MGRSRHLPRPLLPLLPPALSLPRRRPCLPLLHLFRHAGRPMGLRAQPFQALCLRLGPPNGPGLYLFIIILSLSSSLASSFMFVCMGAFFARIADPKVGGTYLTVLNTLSNLGGTWPKALVMSGVDLLSFSSLDGYYVVMAISLVSGIAVFLLFIRPTLFRLSTIPPK